MASALDRETLQHRLKHALQCLCLGHVAGMDGVELARCRHRFEAHANRQSIGRLHHAEHELPGNPAGFLVHAVAAQVVPDTPLSVDAHGGQVIEHHRQVAIDERPQLLRQRALDNVG